MVSFKGVSDTPAWVVAQANQYARDHGKTPFVIYQGLWNVMERSFERDVIQLCKAHGMFCLLASHWYTKLMVARRDGHSSMGCIGARQVPH